jgi:hypothetical protein
MAPKAVPKTKPEGDGSSRKRKGGESGGRNKTNRKIEKEDSLSQRFRYHLSKSKAEVRSEYRIRSGRKLNLF